MLASQWSSTFPVVLESVWPGKPDIEKRERNPKAQITMNRSHSFCFPTQCPAFDYDRIDRIIALPKTGSRCSSVPRHDEMVKKLSCWANKKNARKALTGDFVPAIISLGEFLPLLQLFQPYRRSGSLRCHSLTLSSVHHRATQGTGEDLKHAAVHYDHQRTKAELYFSIFIKPSDSAAGWVPLINQDIDLLSFSSLCTLFLILNVHMRPPKS